jgi:hypothetical protein
VIQQAKAANSKFYKSIYLTDVSSIAVTKKKIDLLLYLTLLSTVGALASMLAEQIVGGVMKAPEKNLSVLIGAMALFFFLLYSFIKVSIISIGTSSLRIDQPISSHDDIEKFILQVEQAKLAIRQNHP